MFPVIIIIKLLFPHVRNEIMRSRSRWIICHRFHIRVNCLCRYFYFIFFCFSIAFQTKHFRFFGTAKRYRVGKLIGLPIWIVRVFQKRPTLPWLYFSCSAYVLYPLNGYKMCSDQKSNRLNASESTANYLAVSDVLRSVEVENDKNCNGACGRYEVVRPDSKTTHFYRLYE
jgi:hypothetical protein